MINYRYAYITGILLLVPIWLSIFLIRKDLRKQQILMSLIVSLMGLTGPIFFNNYWSPEYLFQIGNLNLGFEDIILTFLYGGIGATLYEFIFRKYLKSHRNSKNNASNFGMIIIIILVGIASWIIINLSTDLNPIYTSILGLIPPSIIMFLFRKDLFLPAITAGILFSTLFFIILLTLNFLYPNLTNTWWELEKLSGILILSIPLEEILFHFMVGFISGPFYELLRGYRNI